MIYMINRNISIPKKTLINLFLSEFIRPSRALWSISESICIAPFLKEINVNSLILDLGCGDGRVSTITLNKYKKVVGVDINYFMAQKAKNKKCFESIIVADGHNLPFRSLTFDFVISRSTIYNINHLTELINEVQRIISSNGLFLFSTVSESFSRDIIPSFAHFIGQSYSNRIIQASNIYSSSKWISLVKKQGFKNIKISYFLHSNTAKIWFLLDIFSVVLSFFRLSDGTTGLIRKKYANLRCFFFSTLFNAIIQSSNSGGGLLIYVKKKS